MGRIDFLRRVIHMSKKKKRPQHNKGAAKKKNNQQRQQKDTNLRTEAKDTVAADKRAAKKAAVLGTEKRGHLPLYLSIAFVALIAGFGFVWFTDIGKGSSVAGQQGGSGRPVSEYLFPVSVFQDGKARHFQYRNGQTTIKYFILKSSDGIIRAAFDACDVCWRQRKGYYQDGDVMVCRNCGQRFASIKVNEIKGGCNPSPLRRSIVGDQVVIKVKDLLDGEPYFNFAGRT
jgi:uncharacterized membrane protein